MASYIIPRNSVALVVTCFLEIQHLVMFHSVYTTVHNSLLWTIGMYMTICTILSKRILELWAGM